MTKTSKEAYELANEVFSKSFLVLMAHFGRKLKKDPNYEFPPFLDAMLLASDGLRNKSIKDGERFAGIGRSNDERDAFAVILQKSGDNILIVAFNDLVLGKEVPLNKLLRLIQLAIRFDNINCEEIPINDAIHHLNSLETGIKFVRFPNNQWKKYSEEVVKMVNDGQIQGFDTSSFKKEVKGAKSFGDLPSQARGFMATLYVQKKYPDKSALGIASPENTVPKHKIWHSAKDALYGTTSEMYTSNKRNSYT